MVIYDYSPTKVELQSLIQFYPVERYNMTLGGACYIHLTTETNAVFTGFSARLASACLIPA